MAKGFDAERFPDSRLPIEQKTLEAKVFESSFSNQVHFIFLLVDCGIWVDPNFTKNFFKNGVRLDCSLVPRGPDPLGPFVA